MWLDQRGSEVLTRNECRRLLAVGAGGIGRIGLISDGRVVIEPLNYHVLDDDVLILVGPGGILDAARANSVVAFEVDHLPTGPGAAWSVLVQGLAAPLPARLAERAAAVSGLPAVPEPGRQLVHIRTGVLSGRRFDLA